MPDKLQMMSKDIIQENIDYIAKRFPNTLKEVKDENGKLVNMIDFEVLKQELSNELIDEKQERYQMTWPDKKKSILLANSRINATLRPIKEKSVDFDNTKNIYVEGDNLDVLKLLRETYLNSIKMIYIDPPYNTGNDFVYEDDFAQTTIEYLENSGHYDNQGNRLFTNFDSNGRFHTDWLNMMYPRLKIAKDFLSEDGAIFISIDDNEIHNLMKICDEIYGEANFVGCICRATGTTTGQDANKIGSSADYCLVYSKSNLFTLNGLNLDEKDIKRFNEKDERGLYSTLQLRKTGNADAREDRPNMFYPIIAPDGTEVYPFGPTNYLSRWRVSKDSYKQLVEDNMIVWKKNDDVSSIVVDGFVKSKWVPYVKYYLEGRTKQVSNLFQDIEGNKKASLVLKDLLGEKGIFDNPKPVEFIETLLQISTNSHDLIMDFFSGSATTAHSIIDYNFKNNSRRRYILVQLPELCNDNSLAFKAGYKNICEIGEERIRRAGKKIIEEYKNNNESEGLFASNDDKSKLDIGFRVLKLDSSNMNDVYYNANETSQSLFDSTIDNVKADRTSLDLLFQVMLELGIKLSAKIEEKEVLGKKYFIVNENDIVACFDNNVSNDVIKELAKIKPIYAVFRDSVFENDAANINCEQLFKSISPSTTIKVL